MTTPFYPQNYDIIEGCKVYTFHVDPPVAVKRKQAETAKAITPKMVLGYALYPFAAVIDAAENAICRTAAGIIIAARRRSANQRRSSRELSF